MYMSAEEMNNDIITENRNKFVSLLSSVNIENADIPDYSKKQERLKNEALDMSDKEFNSYVEQFKRGEY